MDRRRPERQRAPDKAAPPPLQTLLLLRQGHRPHTLLSASFACPRRSFIVVSLSRSRQPRPHISRLCKADRRPPHSVQAPLYSLTLLQ